MISAGAFGPCTEHPATSISTKGFLRRSVRFTSSMTLPESEVTTATRMQNAGIGRLRSSAMSPSAASLRARASTCCLSSPSPASSTLRAMNERRPVPAYTSNDPVSTTDMPSRNLVVSLAYVPRHTMTSMEDSSSFT